MESRYFQNPYDDYNGQPLQIDEEKITKLIHSFVDIIVKNTKPGSRDEDARGDLYVGNAGIAFMLWKIHRSEKVHIESSLDLAKMFIESAKSNAIRYKKRSDERCAFLCGNAGIYAVSAAIAAESTGNTSTVKEDLEQFLEGVDACKPISFSKYGCDEVLVGRAGYLSGCYWLNRVIQPPPISQEITTEICETMVESGRTYSRATKAPLPLMYQYHGTGYLGAAHGLCAILQMLLNSPWFLPDCRAKISASKRKDIKNSIDFFLMLQDAEGNFPTALEDLQTGKQKRLLHWCHGAPGALYLLIKAYQIFEEDKYLQGAQKCGELIWQKGLLKKGPGICHGVAGNAYAFMALYRLTGDEKYLYRADKFMQFLLTTEFKREAKTPDRPFSLYEGLAGTVCFLVDLLEPQQASFPFMDIF